MRRRLTLLVGTIIVVALLAASFWIPTVTHTAQASGCYTEFGPLQGGGMPTCNHTETQVPTYPDGQRYLRYAALGVALLVLATSGTSRAARYQRWRPRRRPSRSARARAGR